MGLVQHVAEPMIAPKRRPTPGIVEATFVGAFHEKLPLETVVLPKGGTILRSPLLQEVIPGM
jgi:hypothetical protein